MELTLDGAAVAAKVAAIGRKGNSLGSSAVGVDNVQVVDGDVIGLDTDGSGLVIVVVAGSLSKGVGDGGAITRVAGSVGRVTVDGQGTIQLGDEDLFRVGTCANEDGLVGGGGSAESINSFLDLEEDVS